MVQSFDPKSEVGIRLRFSEQSRTPTPIHQLDDDGVIEVSHWDVRTRDFQGTEEESDRVNVVTTLYTPEGESVQTTSRTILEFLRDCVESFGGEEGFEPPLKMSFKSARTRSGNMTYSCCLFLKLLERSK